jgi:F-box protein 18 (helicase)
LIVEAGAGSGKTTCMIELAKAQGASCRVLYICFNNKGAAEAREKYRRAGVTNTKACTVHALASGTKALYEKAGKFQTKLTVKDIQKHHPCTRKRAWEILETIRRFCESDHRIPTEADTPRLRERDPNEMEELVRDTRRMWEKMIDLSHPAPVSYDHYLKVFELTDPVLDYDFILLDEAQDSNPLTLSILKKQRARTRVVLIGDSNQTIYSWRGAQDAIGSWKADMSLPLSESFRFGKEIATAANVILRVFQKGKKITGHKPQDSLGAIPKDLRHTLIARTNATLFEEALSQIEKGRKFHFVGSKPEDNWDPTGPYRFDDAKDVYKLYIGDRAGVHNPHIQAFESYADLKDAAGSGEETTPGKDKKEGDRELESLCKIVEKYKRDLPGLINKIVENCCSPSEADILLTTCHRAKGLEWPRVRMADDFAKLVIRKPEEGNRARLPAVGVGKDDEVHPEEINLIYVAITRAMERLEPNPRTVEFLRATHLLPPGTEIPKFQRMEDYRPLAPASELKTPTTMKQTPKPILEPQGVAVNIKFELKEAAKAVASKAGGSLRWGAKERKWFWSHPAGLKPPAELVALGRRGTYLNPVR